MNVFYACILYVRSKMYSFDVLCMNILFINIPNICMSVFYLCISFMYIRPYISSQYVCKLFTFDCPSVSNYLSRSLPLFIFLSSLSMLVFVPVLVCVNIFVFSRALYVLFLSLYLAFILFLVFMPSISITYSMIIYFLCILFLFPYFYVSYFLVCWYRWTGY